MDGLSWVDISQHLMTEDPSRLRDYALTGFIHLTGVSIEFFTKYFPLIKHFPPYYQLEWIYAELK